MWWDFSNLYWGLAPINSLNSWWVSPLLTLCLGGSQVQFNPSSPIPFLHLIYVSKGVHDDIKSALQIAEAYDVKHNEWEILPLMNQDLSRNNSIGKVIILVKVNYDYKFTGLIWSGHFNWNHYQSLCLCCYWDSTNH